MKKFTSLCFLLLLGACSQVAEKSNLRKEAHPQASLMESDELNKIVAKDDLEEVSKRLKEKQYLLNIGGKPYSPLFSVKSKKMVQLLVAAGANPNAKDSQGSNALFRPSNAEVVNSLVAAGTDINHANSYGNRPLQYSFIRYDVKVDVVKAMIANGASLTAEDRKGRNAKQRFAELKEKAVKEQKHLLMIPARKRKAHELEKLAQIERLLNSIAPEIEKLL